MNVRKEVRRLIREGVYDQHALFNLTYPHHSIHYSRLRRIIAEEKNAS